MHVAYLCIFKMNEDDKVLVSSAEAHQEAEWWQHGSSACESDFMDGKVETGGQRCSTGQEA